MSDYQKNNHVESESEYNRGTDDKIESEKKRYAGFWMRFWAYITDLIVIFSINGILLSPLKFVGDGRIDIGFWTLNGIVSVFVFYIYFLLMTKVYGQTIGKMVFGLRVIRIDDKDLKWSDLLFREVIGRFIYRAMALLFLLYAVVAFTPEKQGLHDIVGNTRVIHKN
ncbi:RDD family protein [Virgibacillus alimentarius]|uniref:RDD family membrane protein YckC n=1 Tax=Virgibacillus alimentarius TaxID=698769 RepID=A0ABS4SAP4_9BACI|nr:MULTISPECIES: RDD family protein [Virgibacillus]MBP2258583.1 putative RDD family membrane protein YckC [Virgibacillus alimentarius]HLR68425.1 RDD family protein [Virgibacillus sp.]